MDSRLAQIIAASVGADGKPDRAKIFEALSLSPDSPEAFLMEAVVASEDVLHRVRKAQSDALTASAETFARERAALVDLLNAHKGLMEEDARARRRWLTVAMAIPSAVTVVAFILIWVLLKQNT